MSGLWPPPCWAPAADTALLLRPGGQSSLCSETSVEQTCLCGCSLDPASSHETLKGVSALQKHPEKCQPALPVPGVPAAQVSGPGHPLGSRAGVWGREAVPAVTGGPSPGSVQRSFRRKSETPFSRFLRPWRGNSPGSEAVPAAEPGGPPPNAWPSPAVLLAKPPDTLGLLLPTRSVVSVERQ